jgi:hypothetical protein
MRALATTSIVCVLLFGAAVAAYKIVYPNYTYRYRLTVAIEIDGKVHSGSSVIEVTWSGGPEFGDVGRYQPRIRGQGVFINATPHGAIVATLGHPWTAGGRGAALWLAARAFGNNSTNDELPELPRLRGRRDLKPDNMPELLWFSDVANPATARKFTVEEIPALFGPKARLEAAHVEITSDPIVIDIDTKLPWYNVLRRPLSGIDVEYGFRITKDTFIGAGS